MAFDMMEHANAVLGGMAKAQAMSAPSLCKTTLCWKCNASYDMHAGECPVCCATNANVDLDKALAEQQQAA